MFEAARLGDRAAISALLELRQPDIRRYARSACRTSADAEDAAQEALWLLSRHVRAIRSFASLSGWLFTVIRRECLRLARRAGLAVAAGEHEIEEQLLSRPEPELRLDLATAFESLPAHYRDIALMRDINEMSIGEISEALDLSREAVKARLHRPRVMLREFLTAG